MLERIVEKARAIYDVLRGRDSHEERASREYIRLARYSSLEADRRMLGIPVGSEGPIPYRKYN